MKLTTFLCVLTGGGIGASLRFLLSRFVADRWENAFPLGTLIINVLGCFTIGFLYVWFDKWIAPPELRAFLLIGVLGGFTTFSSFGLETFLLFRDAEIGSAILNLALTNVFCMAAVVGGFFLSQWIFHKGSVG